MDFRETTLVELARSVRTGKVSARELVQHALTQIETHNSTINAFIAVDEKQALEQAMSIDTLVRSRLDPGPLAGIPIGIKDDDDTVGYRTTFGSKLLIDSPIASKDSPFVARLKAAGCVVVGKTNTSEFTWSAHTKNSLFGPTRNPLNPEHSPGGSSGGSAAAIASGMVPLATGSDGGGSIRIPSSCCGLSGVKPSQGRVPNGGATPPGWLDLSTKGPMARRISDIITALDVVVGPEPSDLGSLPRPEASWPSVLDNPHLPFRIAWSPTLGYAKPDVEVLKVCEQALSILESMGNEIVQIDKLFDADPLSDWLNIVGACSLRSMESLRSHCDWDTVDPMLLAMIDAARTTPATDLIASIDNCHRMNLRLVELFHDARLLITPTTAGTAPPLALDGAGLINGLVDPNWVQFTYPFNMTRSPAATVCAGLSQNGLPVGIQLIGPQHGDLVVLRSAAALESALNFH